jgi:geranylgeranyl reductase family protein
MRYGPRLTGTATFRCEDDVLWRKRVRATEAFDAIVVGGGPAGALAARTLVLLGHRAVLLERETLPRYKPCGGGLGPKTVARLPFPIVQVPHLRLDRIDFRLRSESPVTWDLPDEFPFYMVMRSDLDSRLVQSAVEVGTDLRDGEPVREIERTEAGFSVSTDRASYQAPFIIGADGATGIVRRALGVERRSEQGVALECEVEVPDEVHRRYAGTAVFDVEAAPDGYGWIFPKPAHLSVGLGSMKPGGLPMRELLQRFLLRYELVDREALPDVVIHTHPLPVATAGERSRDGNALLVGDAAGVADGFGGEGVCYSMASGELAARTVSSALNGDPADLNAYDEELDRLIRRDHGYSNLMGRIVRRFPDPGYRILTSLGEGKSVLIPLLLGEIGFGEALRRLPRLLALDRTQHQTGEAES